MRVRLAPDGEHGEHAEDEQPVEERPRLTAVEGGQDQVHRHLAAGLLGDVAHAKVVAGERREEHDSGNEHQCRDRQHRPPATFHQGGDHAPRADYGRHYAEERDGEGNQQGNLA